MFLPDLLAAHGHQVGIFWDEAWIGGEPIRWQSVAGFDVIVMFQSYCSDAGADFSSLHPNVVYIPMFDQFGSFHDARNDLLDFWAPFQGSKILSFSTAVHTLAGGFGLVSHAVHYYPEVGPPADGTREGLHGFFWIRREQELGWNVVRTLIGSTRFDSFHLHVVGDPGFPPVQVPPSEDVEAHNITMSTWFDRRADFDEVAGRANVYFAPRLAEGIGQSFLEAMGRGQCVIAADNPTMNEYIVHGVNGLLFDPRSPRQLDFSNAVQLGEAARRGGIAGRACWEEAEDELVDFILTPSAALYDDRSPGRRGRLHRTRTTSIGVSRRASLGLRSLARTLKATVRRRALD
jgi:Glycosyl transferases group 1